MNIKGFVTYDEEHKISQFADDTTLFLDVSEGVFSEFPQTFGSVSFLFWFEGSLLAEVSHGGRKMRGTRETSAEIRRVSCRACAGVSLTTRENNE